MSKPKIETAVMSARVPIDVMSTIDSLAKDNGVSRSQFLTSMVATQQCNKLYKQGGAIQARTIPLEIQNLLTAAGVSVAGILGYSLISNALEKQVDKDKNPKFTDNEIEFVSIITALAIALSGYGLIKALTK